MQIKPRRLFGASSVSIVAAAAAIIFGPGQALAQTAPADVRVMSTDGSQVDDLTQYSGTTMMPTSPQALCFGPGSAGSGARVAVPGTNALGVVVEAAESRPRLQPLALTDDFVDDGFGIGVCGIGGAVAQGSAFWYAKVNHKGLQVGGSQFPIARGDQVLWYLTPSFPPPSELVMSAPARVSAGTPLTVQVSSYDDAGAATPAAGATVAGGSAPVVTDATGAATVPVASVRAVTLSATRGAEIPSALTSVCVSALAADCPAVRGRIIVGSAEGEGIRGTAGNDQIKARGGRDGVQAKAGDDRIDLRGGGRDAVNCGGGADAVKAGKGDRTANNCEKVIRKAGKKGKRKK